MQLLLEAPNVRGDVTNIQERTCAGLVHRYTEHRSRRTGTVRPQRAGRPQRTDHITDCLASLDLVLSYSLHRFSRLALRAPPEGEALRSERVKSTKGRQETVSPLSGSTLTTMYGRVFNLYVLCLVGPSVCTLALSCLADYMCVPDSSDSEMDRCVAHKESDRPQVAGGLVVFEAKTEC